MSAPSLPVWVAADPAAWRAATAAAGPQRALPGPSLGAYALEVSRWLTAKVVSAMGRALPGSRLDVVARLLVYLATAAAAAIALLLAVLLLRRWLARRRRPAPSSAPLGAIAGAPRPVAGDADWWRAEIDRRLAAGALRPSLEAAWWWVARRLDPPGLDAAWTTGDLLRRSGATAVASPLRGVDRLLWGGSAPRREEVESLLGELRGQLGGGRG